MAGEPEGLKVTIHGERNARLGLIRRESISVKLLDCFGNPLHIRPEQAELVQLECKGLDEGLLTKIVEVSKEAAELRFVSNNLFLQQSTL